MDFSIVKPQSMEHLAVYVATTLDIRLAHPSFCPGHVSPLEFVWNIFSEKDHSAVLYAARGTGKTFGLAVVCFLWSVFIPKCGIVALGGSLEQSQKIVTYLQGFWAMPNAPAHMLASDVGGRGYKMMHGGSVTALAASPKSVRGPHPQKLVLDEIDEMDKVIYTAAQGQHMPKFGIKDQVVCSSTLHKPYGLMSEVVDNAHETGHHLYKWCIEEVIEPRGFLTRDFADRKRKAVGETMWEIEYLLKRPNPEGSVFSPEIIDKAHLAFEETKKYPYHTKEAGLDWGFNTTAMTKFGTHEHGYVLYDYKEWTQTELVQRCKKIIQECLNDGIEVIYADSNPKDSNRTLLRMIRRKNYNIKVKGINFKQFKKYGINVVRFLMANTYLAIAPAYVIKKLMQYHYKNMDQDLVEKIDDHVPDSIVAWGVSKLKYIKEDKNEAPVRIKLKNKKEFMPK